jgi:hypothetical protein
MSSVCVSWYLDRPKTFLNKCFLDALKYSSCHLRNRLVAFVIDESHVIETWTWERKIQIQNAHFIFMHVPHNLSDHSGPLSQTIPIFCKRTSKLPSAMLQPYCWLEQVHYWNGLPCISVCYCDNGKIRSHVQRFFACKCFWSFFPTWHYRLVVNNHALEIEICVLFTYIRRLLHKACLYYNLLHCILHLIDNTINSDGHRRIFID